MELEEELFELEKGFWMNGKDHFLAQLDEECLLAFPQMGEMHGVHSRETIAATATMPGRWKELEVSNRHLLQPAEDFAIISYRADVKRADDVPYSALIGSAYVRRGNGWKLVFHQHSPVDEKS